MYHQTKNRLQIAGNIHKKNKSSISTALCGKRGIRTPGPVKINGFQDRRIRPLCHLSAAKVVSFFRFTKYLAKSFKKSLQK